MWVGNANTEPPQARKKAELHAVKVLDRDNPDSQARLSDEPHEKRLEQSLASPGTASPVSSKAAESYPITVTL